MTGTDLTAPVGQILINLKSLDNFDDVYEDKNFKGWLNTTFSFGLLGFENNEVYALIRGRRGTLKVVSGKDWSGIIKDANNNINPDAKGVVIGALMPQEQGLQEIKHILEGLSEHMNPDAVILFQALQHKKKWIMMYCLVVE
ncbi:MAG: hypothetical protein ABIF10_04120 [Candidatus Woesearchaeota archaeon]